MIPLAVFLIACGILYLAIVEMAFGVLMRLQQRLEAERENENDALSAYLDDPLKLFVPARVLRGLLLIMMVILLQQTIGTGFQQGLIVLAAAFGISTAVAQIFPALIVRRSPERTLELLLPTFTAIANAIAPFSALIINWVSGPESATAADRAPRERAATAPATPERAESQAPGDERRLLRSVVDFGDTLVREVMTPRPDIVAIQADATIDDLRKLVQEQEYSRLPVYTTNLDNIVGLIVVKDLIQMPEVPPATHPVSEIMRPAAFVPETKRVADLLREFQRRRFQLAIVVDEYGGTAGLVTVEDVVEELVGEIRDEYDSEADPIVREADHTYVFSAKVAIGEIADRLGVEIEDGGFETVGGFVLTRVGRVPATGERFVFDGLEIEVLEAERRRIHKVRIRRQPSAATEAVG